MSFKAISRLIVLFTIEHTNTKTEIQLFNLKFSLIVICVLKYVAY
jgi:hypothetical protein